MATTHLISIDQYLKTDYEPDVDYVDGRVEERNVGETDHSKIQGRLAFLLMLHAEAWHVVVLPAVRVQVGPTRLRVPDVCVVREDGADESIVREAPLLCIEVLSPSDSIKAMRRRAQDYFDMGVPEVWIFDPERRMAYVCSADSMTERTEGVLRLEGTEIGISLEESFKPLKRK